MNNNTYYQSGLNKSQELYASGKEKADELYLEGQSLYNETKASAQQTYDDFQQDKYKAIQDSALTFPIVALVIAVVCICLPIRSLLKKCIDSDEEEGDTTAYEEKVLQFTDDYDISNPLTSKKGRLRLIDLQIAKLEKQGGDEGAAQVQMLRD